MSFLHKSFSTNTVTLPLGLNIISTPKFGEDKKSKSPERDLSLDLGQLYPFRFPSHRVNYDTLSPKKSNSIPKQSFISAGASTLKLKHEPSPTTRRKVETLDEIDDET
jgi:hypothetical protein